MKTEQLNVNWKWFVIFGCASIALSGFAFALPAYVSFSLNILIGLILLANGGFQAVETFKGHDKKDFFLSIGTAILEIGIGGWLLLNPKQDTELLVWVIALIFVCEGVFKLYWASDIRPDATWQWLAINGVIAIIIGGLIGFQIFGSTPAMKSYLIGGNLFIGGLTLFLVGMMNRSPGIRGGGDVKVPLPGLDDDDENAEEKKPEEKKPEVIKPEEKKPEEKKPEAPSQPPPPT